MQAEQAIQAEAETVVEDDRSFMDAVEETAEKPGKAEAEQEAKADDEPEVEVVVEEAEETEVAEEPALEAPKLVKWTGDDGREYEIPEELTTSLMKNKDYTQKTQEVAERRRELEARQQEIELRAKTTEEELALSAQLHSLKGQLDQYDRVDWSKLANDDIYEAQRLQFQRSQVKEQFDRVAQDLNSRYAAKTQAAQQEIAKRVEEAEAYGRANIPGWEQGKDRELVEYARSIGFDDTSLSKLIDARMVKLLHRAMIGDAATKKAASQPKPQPKEAVPVAKVQAKSADTTKRVKLAEADFATYHAAIKRGANPRMDAL